MTGPVASPVALGAAGLAVALSFAMLAARRGSLLAWLCAAQAAVVAVAAVAEGSIAAALLAWAEAAALAWLADRRFPGAWSTPPSPTMTGPSVPMVIAAGTVLAALALTIPGTGLALAIVLLAVLLTAGRPPPAQALGIVALQNGVVLAGVVGGLAPLRAGLVALPLLPALAFGALRLGAARERPGRLLSPRRAAWLDLTLCAIALAVACTLPWQLGQYGRLFRLDARAAHIILLLCALAAAASWAARNTATVWGSRLAILGGTVLAVLSCAPLLSWLGMALAAAGAAAAVLPLRAEAWRRVRLACGGLGLALFGTVAGLHAGPDALPSGAIAMLGYGTLAVLAPELAIAAVALILRLPAGPGGELRLVLGIAALFAAAIALRAGRRGALPLVGLAQAGAAVFAFGLDSPGGNLAGLLQLTLLALTQCAVMLAQPDGLDRLAGLAGLAGVPPVGLFPSLAAILVATAASRPWLLLPLGTGLAAVAWPLLRRLPAERRLLPSPAWLPLALLLILGFAMPHPLLMWFRLAAQ